MNVLKPAQKKHGNFEFPFSLNPGDKPNVTQTYLTELFIIISNKYRTSSRQIQRKIDGSFKRQQNKAHHIPTASC